MKARPPATTVRDEDAAWMARALSQAELGAGLASPNPTVGCVIVSNDAGSRMVGEGFHCYGDQDHAEVVALRHAGSRARDATAYVTLEPCSTQGRTGPCVDALLAAGIVRVVVATKDANPAVDGGGIRRLVAAGVGVTVGVGEREARRLNDAFARSIRTGLPLVTLKAGLSLDGRIAPSRQGDGRGDGRGAAGGERDWITGAESRAEVHRMRHRSDAILLGIGSALADDPLLTDRSGLARRRPLLRGILDSRARLPLDSRLVGSAGEDLIVFCTGTAGKEDLEKQSRIEALKARGVRVVELGSDDSARVPLKEVLEWFAGERAISILLEGGSAVNTQFLREDRVDKVCLFYAPLLLGARAVPLLGELGGQQIALNKVEVTRFGEDVLLGALIHDPWESSEPAPPTGVR